MLNRYQIEPWGGEGEADSRVGSGGPCLISPSQKNMSIVNSMSSGKEGKRSRGNKGWFCKRAVLANKLLFRFWGSVVLFFVPSVPVWGVRRSVFSTRVPVLGVQGRSAKPTLLETPFANPPKGYMFHRCLNKDIHHRGPRPQNKEKGISMVVYAFSLLHPFALSYIWIQFLQDGGSLYELTDFCDNLYLPLWQKTSHTSKKYVGIYLM